MSSIHNHSSTEINVPVLSLVNTEWNDYYKFFHAITNTSITSIFLNDLLRTALDSHGLIREEYLRITGDVALFISGIFPNSLESKRTCFRFEDCIDIGQTAYRHINSEVFNELSVKFPQIVDVLNTVSIRINLTYADLERYVKRRRALNARATRR